MSSTPDIDQRAKAVAGAWTGLKDAMALSVPGGEAGEPTVVAVNRAFSMLFGAAEDEVIGRPLASFLASSGGDRLSECMNPRSAESRSTSELALVRSESGKSVLVEWEMAPVRDGSDRVWSIVSVFRHPPESSLGDSADEERRSMEPLVLSSSTDIQLASRIQRSVERVVQSRTYTFAVIGLDVDGLDAIETRFGSIMSKTVAEGLMQRVRRRLRTEDLVARMEEGRLGIFLDHFDPSASIESVLERIRPMAEDPHAIAGQQLRLATVAAAGSVWSRHRPATSAREVLEELSASMSADAGRSEAPKAKRRGVASATPPTGDTDDDRPLSRLTRAVREGQLHLSYLPLISLDSGEPVGVEALLRWDHPAKGTLASEHFIRDAERTGLMANIGRWVLWRACHQIKAWETLSPRPALPIHLNLSPSEFWDRDLLATLERQTSEVGVNRSRVRLEVPEVALPRDVTAASRILGDLREAGFEIWLDRFGEGGLALRDLPGLPLHRVKAAPLFAWRGDAGRDDTDLPPLLKHALSIARDLGWRVVGTGVETDRQRDMLRAAGCGVGQGFGLLGPINATEAGALARSSR